MVPAGPRPRRAHPCDDRARPLPEAAILALILTLSLAHAEDNAAIHARMAQHLAITTAARSAVISGNLEQAHASAKQLRLLPVDALPTDWQRWLGQLQQSARDLENAPNIRDAATAMGEIGEVCSGCHAAYSGGPSFEPGAIPAPVWSEDTHMPQHLWASQWMWLGMLGNSDEAFLRGAKTLAEEPLLPVGADKPEWFAQTEAAVHEIAGEMVSAKDLDGRKRLYGSLLAQCGTCHLRMETEGATPR